MKTSLGVCSLSVAALAALLGCAAPRYATQYDLILANGVVVDGSGKTRYAADVAIKDGRIAAVGKVDASKASRVLDVRGLVVAPGLIDVHSHADGAFEDPDAASIEGFLRQGVTTAVIGVDGFMNLDTLRKYATLAESGRIGINFMSYIGHNSLRKSVMGQQRRPPTDQELARMKEAVREAMEFGTIGLSSGLMYLPGSFAATDEVIELAKVTTPYAGRYDSHVREEVKDAVASYRECLDIAQAAGVAAHPAHMKAVGAKNFGKGPELVRLVQSRIDRGQQVTVDVYPYDGASTRPVIALLFPGNDERGKELARRLLAASDGDASPEERRVLAQELADYWQQVEPGEQRYEQARVNTERPADGVFSWVQSVGYESMRVVVSTHPEYEGRMVTDLAAQLGVSPFELFRRLVVAEGARVMVTLGAIMESDVRAILAQPWAMISSDGEELNPIHPRGRGTFARLLGRYVRDWKVLTLEQAVFKVTGLPATYLNLSVRGRIQPGAVADIAVFDPETIVDRSTWTDPTAFAAGVVHVFIGGKSAVAGSAISHERFGRFIPFHGRVGDPASTGHP